MSDYTESFKPGDLVVVKGRERQEGIVVGSHYDYAGRQVIQVQLDGELYQALYPAVTRVRRTIAYTRPYDRSRAVVERRVYW